MVTVDKTSQREGKKGLEQFKNGNESLKNEDGLVLRQEQCIEDHKETAGLLLRSKPMFECEADKICYVMNMHLLHDVGPVGIDGTRTDKQPFSNLLVV